MSTGMRMVSPAQRQARLAVRHHLAPAARAGSVASAVAGMIALHGTDPASVYLAAWARTGSADKADVEHALYTERALVRMLGMRRTVFVVPAALVPVIQAACTDQIAERLRRQLTQVVQGAGIAADAATWLKDVGEATVRAVAARGSATGVELAGDEPRLRTQIVDAADNPYGGAVNLTSRLLTLLSAEGLIVRGRPRGGWTSTQFAWSAAGARAELSAAEARAELARRWLFAFGPAPVSDLQWWTGWTAGQVKQTLARLQVTERGPAGEGEERVIRGRLHLPAGRQPQPEDVLRARLEDVDDRGGHQPVLIVQRPDQHALPPILHQLIE